MNLIQVLFVEHHANQPRTKYRPTIFGFSKINYQQSIQVQNISICLYIALDVN
jgi:hypothetical protein